MKKEWNCSLLFIDSERKYLHQKVEVGRKKTLKSSNIKCFKLTVHYFFQEVINKNETVVIFLEIQTHH
jgi:hypothetical protein